MYPRTWCAPSECDRIRINALRSLLSGCSCLEPRYPHEFQHYGSLKYTQIDERSLHDVGDLLQSNAKLADINLAGNRISCTEFEHNGLYLMRLLSSNNTVTVRSIQGVAIMCCVCDARYFRLYHICTFISTFLLRQLQVIRPFLFLLRVVWRKQDPRRGNTIRSLTSANQPIFLCYSSHGQMLNIEDNDVTPKMMTIVAEKLAANRAVRRDMTFVDCLRLKYPRTAPIPVVADPR